MVGALPLEVDVIPPRLNEAEALGWVLDRMLAAVRPIVVDNGPPNSRVGRQSSVVAGRPRGDRSTDGNTESAVDPSIRSRWTNQLC